MESGAWGAWGGPGGLGEAWEGWGGLERPGEAWGGLGRPGEAWGGLAQNATGARRLWASGVARDRPHSFRIFKFLYNIYTRYIDPGSHTVTGTPIGTCCVGVGADADADADGADGAGGTEDILTSSWRSTVWSRLIWERLVAMLHVCQ